MEKIIISSKPKYIAPQIPRKLVYETIDGKPIYFKGYKKVINLERQFEEIMGKNDLQVALTDLVLSFLHKNLNTKEFKCFSNEVGLTLDSETWLIADIAIFKKANFFSKKPQAKYTSIPPQIIIEVDSKADVESFENVLDYYHAKTKKLFNFGVEKVFWILTKNKQIIEAVPNDNWLVKEWDKEIEIIENISFSIDQLLKDDEIYDWVYDK